MTAIQNNTEQKQRNTLLYVWFSQCFGVGSKTAKKIFKDFDENIEAIYKAKEEEFGFERYKRISKAKDNLCDKDLFEAHKTIYNCERLKVNILTYNDPLYPESLKELDDCPFVLYYRGSFDKISGSFLLGAVGTRESSENAQNTAYEICTQIALQGGIIVTGLAKGIDTICIDAAIDNGMYGVGVLGTSIDKIYPPQNKEVFEYLYENGLVISEYPPFFKTSASSFAMRNRLISGLSNALVVFEAGENSGSMITADYAQKQKKEVFAMPGSPDEPNKQGCNLLIKNGANLITSADDITNKFKEYFSQNKPKVTKTKNTKSQREDKKETVTETQVQDFFDLTEMEKAVLSFFKGQPIHSDAIVIENVQTREVLSTLTMLEIKGYICSLPGGRFAKNVK